MPRSGAGIDWLGPEEMRKKETNGTKVFRKFEEVPFGFVSKTVCKQMKLGFSDGELPDAYYFNKTYAGYQPLYDRSKHEGMKLPKYTVKWSSESGYIFPKERPEHYFNYQQCRSFNCVPKREEKPVGYLLYFSYDDTIEKYEPLYERKDVVNTLNIYKDKKSLPPFFYEKEKCKLEGHPVEKKEKTTTAFRDLCGLTAVYDRTKQVRIRKLVSGEYVPQ